VAKTHRILVRQADDVRDELRAVLDAFEARYGLPSDRLMDAFLRPDGHVDETEDFHAWDSAWAHWQMLNSQ